MDETGWRNGGLSACLWTATTGTLTAYTTRKDAGSPRAVKERTFLDPKGTFGFLDRSTRHETHHHATCPTFSRAGNGGPCPLVLTASGVGAHVHTSPKQVPVAQSWRTPLHWWWSRTTPQRRTRRSRQSTERKALPARCGLFRPPRAEQRDRLAMLQRTVGPSVLEEHA